MSPARLRWELWFRRHWPIELAVSEKTLFTLPPINRTVPTTSTRMTASITAYSAMSWPSYCDQRLRRKSAIVAPPCNDNSLALFAAAAMEKSDSSTVSAIQVMLRPR